MVSIVIPNWNGAEKLKKNLPYVLRVKGVDEVIVSDDASDDESVEIIEKEFPEVKLIKRERNSGFSSNVNTGVMASRGDLIFLINNDAVAERDCINTAVHHFKNPKVFSVGLNSGGSWSWAKFTNGFFWHWVSKDVPTKTHQTLWASGGSGIFRRSIWDQLGGLDEIFNPFYEEDVDLGYRAVKRGYINLWEPKSIVQHYEQVLSSHKALRNKEPGVIALHFSKEKIASVAQRNQLIFIWKNITSKKLIADHKEALSKMLVIHPKYWSVFINSLIRLNKILPKRRLEEKDVKVSDEEIFSKFATP